MGRKGAERERVVRSIFYVDESESEAVSLFRLYSAFVCIFMLVSLFLKRSMATVDGVKVNQLKSLVFPPIACRYRYVTPGLSLPWSRY